VAAGKPGTAFHVRFWRAPDGLSVEPEGTDAQVIAPAPKGLLIAFPTLRAAAGAASDAVDLSPEAEHVRLPFESPGEGLFAVRATGDSMDGGKRPIRDGDWLVMRFARGVSGSALDGNVALLQVPDPNLGFAYQVKRVVRKEGGWILRSDNPARPSYEATADIVPIALLVNVVRPEDLAPPPGEELDDAGVAAVFGLDGPPRTGRIDGHLFLCVETPGSLTAPDRLKLDISDRRPGETAFVLTRAPGEPTWRYAGVARYIEEDSRWAFPAVDFKTYRALGTGRGASRSLPRSAEERARALVDRWMAAPGAGAIVEGDSKRCRIVGRAPSGGVRIDGGDGGFAERTVSLTDIGWVLMATDDVARVGGILDEQRVNRLRYIDGTPRSATRWIDTQWALFLVRSVQGA
jgi:hypothetical protein